MKKIGLLLFIIMSISLFGFEKLLLKKEVKINIPLKVKESGQYDIKIYELDYPEKLEEKEIFYEKWDVFIQKSFLNKKKYTILMSSNFYEDYLKMGIGEIFKEEEIISKIASSLTKEEKEELKKITKLDLGETVQDYLNRQIYILTILNREKEEYEKEKQYTELQKEEMLNKLKIGRKKMIKILNKSEITFIVKIDNPYEEETVKLERYYYTKDIILDKKEEFNEKLNNYSIPIYISNLTKKDLIKLEKGEKEIKNTYIILENDMYSGYQYMDKRFLIYLGGEKVRYEYPEYKINLEIKKAKMEELLKLKNEYRFKDVFGGK